MTDQSINKSKELRKGDLLTDVVVETMAAEGKCVARLNGRVIFISGAAPGDIVDVELTKIKTAFLEARVRNVKKLSPNRTTPFCQQIGRASCRERV